MDRRPRKRAATARRVDSVPAEAEVHHAHAVVELQRSVGNAAIAAAMGPTLAREPSEAMGEGGQPEIQRLEDELKRLAARPAWRGVERTYKQLEELGVDRLRAKSHLLGAQGEAQLYGATRRYEELLNRTVNTSGELADDESKENARSSLDELMTSFREVFILRGTPTEDEGADGGGGGFLGGLFGGLLGGKGKGGGSGAELVRQGLMPFSPVQRRTIETAIETLSGGDEYRGHLPLGSYTLNGEPKEVPEGFQRLTWTF